MNVAISAIRSKDAKLNRVELISSIQSRKHKVYYIGIGPNTNDELHSDYSKHNVEYLDISSMGRANTNPIKEIKSIIKAREVLKKNEINAIIVYGVRTFPTMVLAAKLAGVKKIVCVVNGAGNLFMISGYRAKLVRTISFPLLKLAFKIVDVVIFQNKDDYKEFAENRLLLKDNSEFTNGSGVNLQYYRQYPLSETNSFLMISRITGSKGVNEYVKAAQIVKEKHPSAQIDLVGPRDDSDGSVDWKLLYKAELEGIIKYHGKTDDVKSFIKESSIFVFPSFYREGVPRSVLEAMSMGRAIITTDSPGCRETVVDGINGFLVPPKNHEALAEKMIWMIENEDKIEIMGAKSRSLCEDKFDIHQVNKVVLDALL